jgi:hypothetical protein
MRVFKIIKAQKPTLFQTCDNTKWKKLTVNVSILFNKSFKYKCLPLKETNYS